MALATRQNLMVRSALAIVQKVGPWDRGVEANGAGYIDGSRNDGFDQGFACGNCVFMQGEDRCAIVKGKIAEDGLCRLHVIPNDRLTLREPKALGRVVGEVEVTEEQEA
jgi:hypothetical protein